MGGERKRRKRRKREQDKQERDNEAVREAERHERNDAWCGQMGLGWRRDNRGLRLPPERQPCAETNPKEAQC